MLTWILVILGILVYSLNSFKCNVDGVNCAFDYDFIILHEVLSLCWQLWNYVFVCSPMMGWKGL